MLRNILAAFLPGTFLAVFHATFLAAFHKLDMNEVRGEAVFHFVGLHSTPRNVPHHHRNVYS